MAPLPHRDLRHPWLRYQVNGYDKGIVHSYEQRLEMIWGRPVNQVHVLDFVRLADGMRQTLGDRLSMVYDGMIGRHYLLVMHVGGCLRLRDHCPGTRWQQAATAGALGAAKDASAGDEGAQAIPAHVQAPQPPLVPRPQTMSQRIDRPEEKTRVSTWMISCMTHLMDANGRTYQAFDSTLVGSLRLSYERRVRPRIGDANTSAAPQTDDQPTLDLFSLTFLIIIFCGLVLYNDS
uniref:Uncharacterized protein n=1 Tax=Tanacetum cinerariifolium TaxID=118510 RepID=A0A6L2KUS4_TANCI|nr:hypothetical protein [Tanacetum cinerariifolium]